MRVFKHVLDSGDIVEIFLEGREIVMKVSPDTGATIVTLFTHDELCEFIDSLSDLEDILAATDAIEDTSAPLEWDSNIQQWRASADFPSPDDVENWLNDSDSDLEL